MEEKDIKYSVKKEPGSILEVDIQMPWERVEPELDKVFREIRQHVQLPGFRKGRIPMEMVKDKYSVQAREELLNRISPQAVGEVLEKESINPVTVPQITDYDFVAGTPLKLQVKVEVAPDIQLKKYTKLKLTRKQVDISEEDIGRTVEKLTKNNASLKTKQGAVEKGDYAIVRMKVLRDSSEVDTGLPEERMIEVGQDGLLPGFSDRIEGMKKDDTAEFEYTFGEDFPRENLRGVTVVFNVTVKEVKEKVEPSPGEVAESLGFESVDKMEEHIRENLQSQAEDSAAGDLDSQIVDKLLEKHDMELPEGLVEESLKRNMRQMESYVKSRGGDPAQIDMEQMREKTRRELKAGLILREIAGEEGIQVTDEDRAAEEARLMKMMNTDDSEMVKKYIDDSTILTKKVFDFVKENSKIKVQKVKNTGGTKE